MKNKDFDKLDKNLQLYDDAFGDGDSMISSLNNKKTSEEEEKARFSIFDKKNDEEKIKSLKETLSSSKCGKCGKMSLSILNDIYLTKYGKCQMCYLKEEKLF